MNLFQLLQRIWISKFVIDISAFGFITFIIISAGPAGIRAFKDGLKTGSDRFLFSYWLLWIFNLIQRAWVIFVGLLNRPEYLTHSPFPGLLAVMLIIAAAHGIVAPITGHERLETNHILLMVISGILSGIIIGIAIGVYIVNGWFYL